MNKDISQNNQVVVGTLYAIAAFVSWGVLPVFWKLLSNVPSKEILAHRIVWSFVFMFLLLLVTGIKSQLKSAVSSLKNLLLLFVSAIIIGGNWYIFIWAVTHGYIVESSMGYYICPLVSVILGVVVLKEKLNFWQLFALGLAIIGVVIMTVKYGQIPWIALTLAVSFGLYGLLKKLTHIDSMLGLTIETFFLTPFCLIYLSSLYQEGIGSFGIAKLSTNLLLLSSGVVTAVPILWFVLGAKRIPLSSIGFIQYLGPSIMLMMGVLVEYALVLVLVAVVVIAILTLLGPQIGNVFSRIVAGLNA